MAKSIELKHNFLKPKTNYKTKIEIQKNQLKEKTTKTKNNILQEN